MRKDICIRCDKYIELGAEFCPYCGINQFDEGFLSAQAEADARELLREINKRQKSKKIRTRKGFTDEEILALGLYPDDEGYKMSLISRILGK